jgi:hypothetical protein
MPGGPGDEILKELDSGTADDLILKKYKINSDQLFGFKSLRYGLKNNQLKQEEIKDYFPELNDFFTAPQPAAIPEPVQPGTPGPLTAEQLQAPAGQQPAAPPKDFDLLATSKKRKELQSKISEEEAAGRQGKTGGIADPYKLKELEGYRSELKGLDEQTKGAGYDNDLLEDLQDIPEGKGFSIKKALPDIAKLRDNNHLQYNRVLSAVKSKGELFNAISKEAGESKAHELIQGQQELEKINSREATRNAIGMVRRYVHDTDEQNKVIRNIITDKSYDYGMQPVKEDERTAHMNPYQQRAMQFLEDVDPATYKAYQTLLASDPSQGFMGSKEQEIMRGYETKARELEMVGIGLERKAIEERLTDLKNKPELNEQETSEYNELMGRYETLAADMQNQNQRYPHVAAMDAYRLMQESLGARNSIVKKFFLGVGENMEDARNWVGDLIVDRGVNGQLELLGDKEFVENVMRYTPEKDKYIGSNVVARFDDYLQKQVDEIKNSKLSDDAKQDKITGLILKSSDKISIVPNDRAGKTNWTSMSVLNLVGDMSKDLVSQLVIGAATGGAGNVSKVRQLTSLFGSTFATSYDDNYVQALRENNPNPSQEAFVKTSIEAASELISNDFEVAKKILGKTSSTGKLLNKITKEQWDAVTKTGKFSRLKQVAEKTATTALGNAKQEVIEETAGHAASNLADEQLFAKETGLTDGVGETALTTFVGMLPLGLLSLPFNYRNINRTQKYMLYEAGMDPGKFKRQVDTDLESGAINEKEAQVRKQAIDRAAASMSKVQAMRTDGSLLTDNEKTDYLANQVVIDQIEEQKKNVPAEQKEKLEEVAEKLDKENAELLKPKKKKAEKPQAEPEEGSVRKYAHPEMEYPIHAVRINGEDRFLQRMDDMNSGSSWYEIYKDGDGFTLGQDDPRNIYKHHRGDNKKEAVESLLKKYKKEDSAKASVPAEAETSKPEPVVEEAKSTVEKPVKETEEAKAFRDHVLESLPAEADLLGGRIEVPGMKPSEVRKAAADIKAGKNTVGAKRLEAAVNEIVQSGSVPLMQGTGGTVQRTEVPLSEYMKNLTQPVEHDFDLDTPEKISAELAKLFEEPAKGSAVDKLESSAPLTGNNTAAENSVDEYLAKAGAVLNALYPDIKIDVYDKDADYLKETGRPKGSVASFSQAKNKVSYNLEGIKRVGDPTTIFHEIVHPIVEEAMNKNDDVLRDLYTSLELIKKEPGMERVWEHEKEYGSRGGKVQKVEAVVEFFTQVASGNIDTSKLPTQTITKIIDFINKVLKAIGIDKQISTAYDLKRFADSIAEAFTTGDPSGLRELLGAPTNVKKHSVFDAMRPIKSQEDAIKSIIKRTPKSVSDQTLHDTIMKATKGIDPVQLQSWIDEIRKPPVPPSTPHTAADKSPEERNISLKKFDNATKETKQPKPSWWKNFLIGFANMSAWWDNPYRFVTKIIEDIRKEYDNVQKDAIPLGRAFEKNASGRAALKVQAFVNEVLLGKIGDEKLGRIKGEELKDFTKYLMAKRVIDRIDTQERKRADGEDVSRQTGNITKQDAQVQLEELEKKYGPEKMGEFDKRGDAFQDHMDRILKNLQAAGIISEDTYNQIKADNNFYAPFSVVQEKILSDQKSQPVGISGVIKRIKGIGFNLPKGETEVTSFMNELSEAMLSQQISPEEYFKTAYQTLTDLRDSGEIDQARYDRWIASLENPGFQITSIIDAAANMIYKAEGMALKNTMMQRLYAYKQYDTKGLFIQDVDGFQPMTVGGETRMVPKPLNTIPVEEGMAAIKLRLDGEVKIVAVNKKAAEKLNTMNNFETSALMKGVDFLNQIFRTIVITLSPGFQAVNFAIDFVRTTMLSRYGVLAGKGLVQPLVNAILYPAQYIDALVHSALGNLGYKTDTYKQWMKSDSFSKGMFDNLFDNEKKVKEITATNAKRMMELFTKLKIFKLVEIPGSILEQTHKLAVHQRGMAVEGFRPEMFTAMWSSLINQNINDNMTKDELKEAADRLNYEVQNFAGSPNFPQTHKWLKIASIFLQFLSARVKGEMTDYRRVANLFLGKGEGVRLSKQDRVQLLLQYGTIQAVIVAYAIANNADDEDEEQFDSIPTYHQDNYLNIPAGEFEFEFDDGSRQTFRDYFKVPLRGLTAAMNVTANKMVKYRKHKDPEHAKKAFLGFLGTLSPINLQGDDEREIGESLVSNLTPVFKYFMEYSFNRDTHKHRDIIPDSYGDRSMLSQYKLWLQGDEENGLPPWEVATDKTPPWTIELSKFLYDEMGINAAAISLDHMENTMGNPTELYENAVKKRLVRSKMKYPVKGATGHVVEPEEETIEE